MLEFSEQFGELVPKQDGLEPVGKPVPQPDNTTASEPQLKEGVASVPEEKEKIQLSKPSKELAKRLLTQVGFKDRLIGYKMTPMQGNLEESIYSFKDANEFLWFDFGEFGVKSSGSIGYIDPIKLEKWIFEVFGDKELAEAIGKKTKESNNYKERLEAIKPLVEQRLKQCWEIIGEKTEA